MQDPDPSNKNQGCASIAGYLSEIARPLPGLFEFIGLPRPASHPQRTKHLHPAWNAHFLGLDLLLITREGLRLKDFRTEVKASPCPPRPHLGSRSTHSGSEMLKMPHRISQKSPSHILPQHPYQRSIRRLPLIQNPLTTIKICRPRLVELKNRLRRFACQPQRLGVFQGRPVKVGASVLAIRLHRRRRPQLPALRQERTAWHRRLRLLGLIHQ